MTSWKSGEGRNTLRDVSCSQVRNEKPLVDQLQLPSDLLSRIHAPSLFLSGCEIDFRTSSTNSWKTPSQIQIVAGPKLGAGQFYAHLRYKKLYLLGIGGRELPSKSILRSLDEKGRGVEVWREERQQVQPLLQLFKLFFSKNISPKILLPKEIF